MEKGGSLRKSQGAGHGEVGKQILYINANMLPINMRA